MLAPTRRAFHFLTHIGSSWILAGLGPASRRDRRLIVLAGAGLDLDGAGRGVEPDLPWCSSRLLKNPTFDAGHE